MEGWWDKTVPKKTGSQGTIFNSFTIFPLVNLTTAMQNNMKKSHKYVEPKNPGI